MDFSTANVQGVSGRFSRLWTSYAPGLLLASIIAIAAQSLGQHYGAPVMLFALLIGMAFNFLAQDSRCAEGIEYGSKSLLRVGVALLGLRISAGDFMELGIASLAGTVSLITLTIGFGLLGARLIGQSWQFGLLTGGAVAICGASAALALAAVLPTNKQAEKETLFTVIAVTALSTIAMIVYAIIIEYLGLTDKMAGFILGATIHDVAQVVGAGYSISEPVGETATIVKLMRVSCLPLVLLLVLFMTGSTEGSSAVRLPGFLIAFAILATLNTFHLVPAAILEIAGSVSRWILVVAIAALGVRTSIQAMLTLGKGQIALVVAETLFLLVAAIVALNWIFAA